MKRRSGKNAGLGGLPIEIYISDRPIIGARKAIEIGRATP
jgi:hypothetical protein